MKLDMTGSRASSEGIATVGGFLTIWKTPARGLLNQISGVAIALLSS
jgi:hypothetical protein